MFFSGNLELSGNDSHYFAFSQLFLFFRLSQTISLGAHNALNDVIFPCKI